MSALTPRVLRGLAPPAALATLLLTPPALRAQEPQPTHVVSGSVVDATTGDPVSQARVSLEDAEWGVFTQADGSFRIEGVAAGNRTLLAERLGYRATRTPIVVRDEGPTSTTLRL
ncbi:MAG TPA: carboxypeptidase regulatory-like domain-containing protein, partial [Longimicrobiales bacterium]|nr:carboxypeptidase regulatory-like domain-containing protein [Longimicrobiales bacterium]